MSIWTSLNWVRAEPVGDMTCARLADFLRGLQAIDIIDNAGLNCVEALLGKPMDADTEPAARLDHGPNPEYGLVGRYSDPDWDIDFDSQSDEPGLALGEMCSVIANRRDALVYRAFVGLGYLSKVNTARLTRHDTEDGAVDLALSDVTFEVGPLEVGRLADDDKRFIGWVTLALSGGGYLSPWTCEDLVGRADALPEVKRVKRLCVDTWSGDWRWAVDETNSY